MRATRIVLAVVFVFFAAAQASAEIGVIVNKDLYPYIQNAVDRYVTDLENSGETVWLETAAFGSGDTRPELRQLRSALRERMLKNDLTGAVLIGDLPRADYENFKSDGQGGTCVELTYPIDYYFMDLDKQTDADWKDENPDGDSDVFDGYSGDKQMEIWVSRIVAHNFLYESDEVSIGVPKTGSKEIYEYGTEADIINDYLYRVHRRMTAPAVTPRRALNLGDYKNWFDEDDPGVQHLGVPYFVLKYPHDTPAVWVRELQLGYEMAAVFEHSSPLVNHFALDQPENSNGIIFGAADTSGRDLSFLHLPVHGGQSTSLFFNSFGCSNMQYDEENCLGQMYAILQSGLTGIGATTSNWGSNSHEAFTKQLARGEIFGEAFKAYVNTLTGWQFSRLTMTLLGAGTLQYEPYEPNPDTALRIERIWSEKAVEGPYLHGDTVRLFAEVTDENGYPVDDQTVTYTWYGLEDTAIGNGADFILEGHNLPTYSRSEQGEYFITLHVDGPGYQSASDVISLKGWRFAKFGPTYYTDPPDNNHQAHLNRHYWDATDGWVAGIRGLSKDIGGNDDDFVFYTTDIASGDFEIVTRIKGWRNQGSAQYDEKAKAGVMIRSSEYSTSCANAFVGVTYSKGAVFQYRSEDGENTIVDTAPGYTAGSTWVKLHRKGREIFGYASTDGVDYHLLGSMIIGPAARLYAGFAYACNDETAWEWNHSDFTKERGVDFSHMDAEVLSQPDPVTPYIEYVNNVDGTFTVYFGYYNPNDYNVIVEEGDQNHFTYSGPGDVGAPITEFEPGRHRGVQGVTYDGYNGKELSWTINDSTVTTSGRTPRTIRIRPILEQVVNNCDGTYTAVFGYRNEHAFPVTKENGDLNAFEYAEGNYWQQPITEFEPGRVENAMQVTFSSSMKWNLDNLAVKATDDAAANVCPPFQFYRAFAFGADGFTRKVPSAPGAQYIKIVQNGANFQYEYDRGYGYTDIEHLDTSTNNRGVLSGDDEIYDQFIGVKNKDYGYNTIVFRIDVPPGIYRFVAAGGDARYDNHRTTIRVTEGGNYYYDDYAYDDYYDDGVTLVEDVRLEANTFWRVGFDDRRPPAGDGSGKQPEFLPIEQSPYLKVTDDSYDEYGNSISYIEILQTAPGDARTSGGDLCLLELWYIPEIISITNGEPKGRMGVGGQTDQVTEPQTWRWAEWYYGHSHIDQIVGKKDGCGRYHNYAVGWHQGDLAEYLMKFGGEFSRLILRGIADRPGPVELEIYIDGEYKATAYWDDNDNCNQDVKVDIPGVPYGTHAVAVQFVNDKYRKGQYDRNMYLDGLYVDKWWGVPSLTKGEPKGRNGIGGQTDKITPPGVWRQAEWYYGHKGIDEVAEKRDGCGTKHGYAVGWHQDDTAEYLMKMGGDKRYLILRAKADRPGPVEAAVYIDGKFHESVSWDNDNDANQDVLVHLYGLPYGTHAVAIKFTNDFWDPNVADRNLYLDALRVSAYYPRKVVSDQYWQSFDQYVKGWNETGFDDSNWRNAHAPYPNPSDPDNWICGTQARFMWDYPYDREPNGRDGPKDAWFRKSYHLYGEDFENLTSARVTLTADDDFDLFVNGTRVFSDWDGRLSGKPYSVDIEKHLVEGENVIAVHARDSYGIYEWVLLEAVFE